MHLLSLLRCCSLPGSNSPHRLISDHKLGHFLTGQPLQTFLKLPLHHFKKLPGFAFSEGFTDAKNRNQAVLYGCTDFFINELIIFFEKLAAFGMP